MQTNSHQQDLVSRLFFHLENALFTQCDSEFSLGYREAAINAAKAVIDQLKTLGVNAQDVIRSAEKAAVKSLSK